MSSRASLGATSSSYAIGTSTYSENSPWWWANRLKLLCDLNHTALSPTVRRVFDVTERWEMERQSRVEAKALRQIQAGKETEAVSLLQQFINENCERVEKEYRTFYDGMGGWRWGGFGETTTQVENYPVGSLILDFYDAHSKQLIWRGVATDSLSDKPEKNEQKLEKSVHKMLDHFPPK